jgi:hypothetical protein
MLWAWTLDEQNADIRGGFQPDGARPKYYRNASKEVATFRRLVVAVNC